MTREPQILSIQTLAKTRLFTIEGVDLEFANGNRASFERLTGSSYGAILIVPLLDNNQFLLVREYSVGVEQYELGFPRGKIEPNESAQDTVVRELKEEVGYGAKTLSRLRNVSLAPGYTNFKTQIFIARDLYPARLPGDEPEPLEVVPWAMSDVDRLLERRDFNDARCILAVYLLQEHLKGLGK